MVEIRKAKESDLLSVYNLVKELAVYENEPDAVTTSLAVYQEAFRKEKIRILVAVKESEVVGMMLYYWAFSTWKGPMYYLEDFVVSQNYRHQGIGQFLFDFFLEDAKKNNVTMVKWQVLDWNKPAINFYLKNKATIEKEWWNVKMIF
jgi:ribosomal protein S18 acetylase RimI-like enzyme